MERQQILDRYEWEPGICFRHPGKGDVRTLLVAVLRPRDSRHHELRLCEDCVIAVEDARREMAARAGCTYEPGHVGELAQ
ncbi:hypothetical protein AB0E62_33935 [Streptomyces sp. NPDC038707]|uniref:hypothetical protein n=1 Tax=Streptomyces sp. NPDC038707 TaxID=3154329 RepID=UPI0033C2AE41